MSWEEILVNDFLRVVDNGTTLISGIGGDHDSLDGDLVIPESILAIGHVTPGRAGCFYQQDSLQSVYAPNVRVVENWSFMRCWNLQSVDLPNVVAVFDEVFFGCGNLTTINIPSCIFMGSCNIYNNVTSLTVNKNFGYRDDAIDYHFDHNNITYFDDGSEPAGLIHGLTWPELCYDWEVDCFNLGHGRIGVSAHDTYDWDDTTQKYIFDIHACDDSIESGEYMGKISYIWVSELTLPAGIDEIMDYGFYHLSQISRVTAPGVTTIGAYAFAECGDLDEITARDCIKVKEYAFVDCDNLYAANFAPEADISSTAFVGCLHY